MIAVIQRTMKADVVSDGILTGKIEKGLALFIGIHKDDTEKDVEVLAPKIAKLRIFSDENDKMNLSVNDVNGSVIVVSNFTLCANYVHGNRPDYFDAKEPNEASRLFSLFVNEMKKYVSDVQTGVFGASMVYTITNDGPITIVMDSNKLKK